MADDSDGTENWDQRQDHGDLYQAPLQAIHLGNQTVWRTLLWNVHCLTDYNVSIIGDDRAEYYSKKSWFF